MKSRSCKAKGRRVLIELRELILQTFPQLEADDVLIHPTSVGGEDLKLSPAARRLFPFSVEGKNQQKLNIWAALAQATDNANGHTPAVVFRRNHHAPWVAIPLDAMLRLLSRLQSQHQSLFD